MSRKARTPTRSSRLVARLLAAFEHPRARPAVLVALLLALSPMPFVGFQLDDLVQRGLFLESDLAPIDMFRFAPDADTLLQRKRDALIAWWADPSLQMAFFRPVTAWTHWLDYQLAPSFYPWHALHTAAWYAVACAAAWAIYRKVLPEVPGAAGAALLGAACFALDDAHGMTLGWLANRNAIVAAATGFSAIAAHLHGQRVAAAVLLGLSLGAGEAGVATVAYLGAAILFLDRRVRWSSVPIYAVPVVAWAVAWGTGGYGARHSDTYADVFGAPRDFLGLVVERAPMSWASAFTLPFCDLWGMLLPDDSRTWARAVGLLAVALTATAWPLLREDRGARFLFVGSWLALVPVSATLPAARLLLFAGLGAAGLLARAALWVAAPGAGWVRSAGWTVLLVANLVLGPLLLPFAIHGTTMFSRITHDAWEDVVSAPEDEGTELVALQAPLALFAPHLPWARRLEGSPAPAHLWVVAPSEQRAEVARLDDRTLRMTVDRGFAPAPGDVPELGAFGEGLLAERLDRSLTDGCPWWVGQAIDLGLFEVRVVDALPDGRPVTVDLVFDRPLEDPSLRFVSFERGRARAWIPLEVGESEVLPANPVFPEARVDDATEER